MNGRAGGIYGSVRMDYVYYMLYPKAQIPFCNIIATYMLSLAGQV